MSSEAPAHGSDRLGEEIASSIVHAIGTALSIAGIVLLLVYGARTGDGWRLGSALVFGLTLFFLYAASTLYHALPQPRAKRFFKVLDHVAIYLLIAGTYTPFTLVTLRENGSGWLVFALVWGAAVIGVATEVLWVSRPRWLSVLVYLAMGWVIVISIGPLRASLAPGGVSLVLAGGLSYTVGTLFYLLHRVPYLHAVWHGWVLGGSTCHFLAVLLFVL